MSDDITEAEPPDTLQGGSGDITESEPPDSDITESEPPKYLTEVLQPERRTKSLHEQRYGLATRLLVVVAVLAGAILLACVFVPEGRLETIKSIAPVLFGPIVTLFGTSVAWYYATDNKSDNGDT